MAHREIGLDAHFGIPAMQRVLCRMHIFALSVDALARTLFEPMRVMRAAKVRDEDDSFQFVYAYKEIELLPGRLKKDAALIGRG